MESPFYLQNTSSNMVILYLEPILNTYYQTYMNILTVSNMPAGPLSRMVFPIRVDKLSPFQALPPGASCAFPQCTLAIGKYTMKPVMNNSDTFMTAEDIPALFSYLETNGYVIDRSLTHMLIDSKIKIGGASTCRYSGNKQMVCMFSYGSR
uniref:Uncharacterized protein n=1 Tax=viral metagenome TaxID=1070528 RepID=A0A6C0JWN4_9ZZZZ